MCCLPFLVCVPILVLALVVGGIVLYLYLDKQKKQNRPGPPQRDDWPEDTPSGWDEAKPKPPDSKDGGG